MGWKGLRLTASRTFALLFAFWLAFAGRGVYGQSATDGASAEAASDAPADDAAARMARIEAQLQTLDARNKQLERRNDDLMKKYQSLLRQGSQPVFGAEANNPDGTGVPGAIVTCAGEEQKSGDQEKEGTRPKAGEGKETGGKTGEKKEEKKDGKTEEKKDEPKKQADDWYEVGSDGALKAVWRDRRLFLESSHKDFQIRYTGRFQWDTGWFDQTPRMPNLEDGSAFRRARLGIEGYLYENFYFRTRYDFADSGSANDNGSVAPGAGSTSNFRDVFMRVEKLPFISNFQAGQWKEPISLTWQSTSNQLIFVERPAMFNALNPGRNVGFSVFRNYFDDHLFFITGLFRSSTNNGGFSVSDGGWASTSRLAFLPLWEDNGRYLVHFGGSYSYRAYNHIDTNSNVPNFSTIGDVAVGTPNVLSTGTIADPYSEDLLSGEFVTVLGPLSIQSEILGLRINGISGKKEVGPLYWGTYAQVSYFLTGENRRFRRTGPYAMSFTTPNIVENFFTVNRWPYILGRGAWEVAARYDYLDLSGGGLYVPTASNGSGGTGRWNGMSYALNWWLNSNSTIMFDYVHGWRSSDTVGRSGQMDAFVMRFRFFF